MLKEILHSPLFMFSVAFPLRYLIEGFLERRFCAHEFDRRATIFADLIAIFLFLAVFSPAAQYVSGRWGYRLPVSHQIDAVPLPLRVVMYLVVADFCHYWLHRLIHQPFLWRIHQWHHSPTHMSWTAGFRGTFFDATIINLAYVFAFPLLGTTSYRFQVLLLTFFSLKNDWMHLNVNWRFPWLEKFIVTPRYHHIHHSVDATHHNKNLGVLLSIWDRLFGTHVDPDTVKGPIRFGTGENVPTARLIVGV